MADTTLSARSRKNPWAITFFGLLAAGGLVAMPLVAGPPSGDQLPDIVRFVGHFHPVLLHLPIGVFVLILLQELGAIFGRRHHEEVANPALFPLLFGALSAIVAVIAGFLLYQGGEDYAGSALAERHLWGGVAFAVAAVLAFILKAWTVARAGNPAFYRSILFASVAVMGFASHDGASITHGADYLTVYAPDPIRGVLGLEKKAAKTPTGVGAVEVVNHNPVVYTDLVAPIFERRCVQCHKEDKAKGKLRMDTYEMLVKGGKEGPGLEIGAAAKSNVVMRSELPVDDDDRMPPDGKPGMDESELMVVKWWIDNGADPKKTLADFEVPAAIQDALSKLPTAKASSEAAKSTADSGSTSGPAAPVDEAFQTAVAGYAKEFPGALAFESQQSSLLTFTAVSMRGNLDDATFKKLEPVTAKFVSVDLSATKITDQAVSQLAAAKDLKLIRLPETSVTDACIDTLVTLPALESINLYGTKVTDAGVSKLSTMLQLKRLYLWKTAVTPEAIQALKEKLPNCEIITGIDA
jgi:uncharacterized membrane protein